MEKIKAFFKKYVNIANLIKVWEYKITKEDANKVIEKIDKDGNGAFQVKDLFIIIAEKVLKK